MTYNCYIIGYPLNNPRSVKLWKNFFKKKKIPSSMEPYEVKKKYLKKFFFNIKKNKKFLASAITTPLKIDAFKYAFTDDVCSKRSESFNLIIKKNNKIYGYNTDILALLKIINKFKFKSVLIIGLGGVGLALAKVLRHKKNVIYTLSRNTTIKNDKKVVSFRNVNEIDFNKINLIINCTPLGSDLKKQYIKKSPLSIKTLQIVKSKKIKIIDIIYKPKKTLLSKMCKKLNINYSNGIEMNTFQAKIALDKINSYLKKNGT